MSILGIDIGTTAIKCCVLQASNVVALSRRNHNSEICTNSSMHEQDVVLIVSALDECLSDLKQPLGDVKKILICGQMHGVVLWKRKPGHINIANCCKVTELLDCIDSFSNLITWQDKRCDDLFIRRLPESLSLCRISSGYGWASIHWLEKHKLLDKYTMCGTIMDFLVWLITQNEEVVMSPHNAKSWGYFDYEKSSWECEQLSQLVNLSNLQKPKIVNMKTVAGKLHCCLHTMQSDTDVYVALGDMQCAIRAAVTNPYEAVLTIGTGLQFSIVVKKKSFDLSNLRKTYPALDVFPYNEEHILITATSLNGGNVIDAFASMIQTWMSDLDCANELTKEDLFLKLETLAREFKNGNNVLNLKFQVTSYGERHKPHELASVSNISHNNCSLGSISYGIYKGLIDNVETMLPQKLLNKHGIQRIVGTGGLLSTSNVLKEIVQEVFQMPFNISPGADAPVGAALFGMS